MARFDKIIIISIICIVLLFLIMQLLTWDSDNRFDNMMKGFDRDRAWLENVLGRSSSEDINGGGKKKRKKIRKANKK